MSSDLINKCNRLMPNQFVAWGPKTCDSRFGLVSILPLRQRFVSFRLRRGESALKPKSSGKISYNLCWGYRRGVETPSGYHPMMGVLPTSSGLLAGFLIFRKGRDDQP